MTTDIEKKEMFFENEDNAHLIDSFLRKARVAHIEDDARRTRLSLSKEIIEYIAKAPNKWDEKCQFNIKRIGDNFLQMLRDFNSTKPTKPTKAGIKSPMQNYDEPEPDIKYIDEIYFISYRFLCEYDFFVDAGKELVYELRSIKERIQNDKDQMSDYIRSQISYASYTMPVDIIKEFVNDSNIGAFKDFEQKKVEAETLKKEWDAEIETKTADVDALKKSLEKYKNGFNFVGLYQGFDDLATEKQKERDSILKWLRRLSGLIVVPIIVQMFFVYWHIDDISSVGYGLALLTLSTFSLVAIAIYYFRVLLFNYKSVKSQLLQIDLRKTLCRFIQDYAKQANKMKKEDVNSLEKFESIIFSGIVAEDRNIPSTFDGGEQFGKWIGRFIKSEDNKV